MSKASSSYKEELLKDLANPDVAAAYLSAVLEDGSREEFVLALRDVAQANGISNLPKTAQSSLERAYGVLSARGNKRYSSIRPLLSKMGLRLTVTAKKEVPA